MTFSLDPEKLGAAFDPRMGAFGNAPVARRHLSDLRGRFCNAAAYDLALKGGDPLVYTVAAFAPADGAGDLHCGLGILYPGRIGDEYYLTAGHLHARREAAEFYIGLAGEGVLLLEDEATGESRIVPLRANGTVYVPGHTAHRTINTGSVPLAYLGVTPANAGHDYAPIAERNFRCVVVERNGLPAMLPRPSLP
jgi:glucose-6-phosphate isomerase